MDLGIGARGVGVLDQEPVADAARQPPGEGTGQRGGLTGAQRTLVREHRSAGATPLAGRIVARG